MKPPVRVLPPLAAHIVCGIFFAVAVLLFCQGMGILINVHRAQTWQEVPARKIEASLEEQRDTRSRGDSPRRQVKGVYAYTWEGREYQNRQIEFSGGSNNFSSNRYRAQYERLTSDNLRVHVNPANPSESVLDATFPAPLMAFYSGFLLFPCFLGIAWFWRVIVTAAFKSNAARAEHIASRATIGTFLVLPVLSMVLHPMELAPGQWFVFWGVCAIALGAQLVFKQATQAQRRAMRHKL